MKPLDFDSSSMEDNTSKLKRHRQILAKAATTTMGEEEGNSEMWNNFSNRFRQVQSVLDLNRLLIKQVNDSHQSRTNDNMVQNEGLIRELNGNISKVVSLYSDLSTNFSTIFHHPDNDNTNNH
ncbi:hypothetical protein RND71_015074 [Anisodus tanguticus]|uniref:Protein EARLY FLOWERING 4 domain-containing protein n=1 Tax=Anisodus tanguticus TaxID=243964 RepID=A0AAE1VNC1_9SOLA|nr:hypothetical protein RND71_015074 [Anisodus tanguticus]